VCVRALRSRAPPPRSQDNDVHVVGVSSQAAGHKTLVPKIIEELKRLNGGHIKVVVGGGERGVREVRACANALRCAHPTHASVIPPDDYDFLRAAGVVGIYGPGTRITAASDELVALLQKEKPDA